MLNRKFLLRSALLLLICATLPATMHASAMKIRRMRHTQPSSIATPLFDFHNNFWVNLHQILLHEALLRAGKPDRRLQSRTPLSAPHMSRREEAQWGAAVSFYAAHFGTRREVFSDQLIQINDMLAKQPDDGSGLDPAGLPPDVVTVLRSASPIYRKYWWSAHDQSNVSWIASQRERVRELGPKLAAAISRDLHQPWPSEPIRVDVCYYVPEIGHAYTTVAPPHTTYSSSDPTHQGLTGFELLFHEASHSFARVLTNALSAACRAQHKDCGDLWHTALFYTSGVELRRLLPASEQAGFTPYGYKYGLYTRGPWPKYLLVLETDWQAYLDRKTNFQAAIHSMAVNLQP